MLATGGLDQQTAVVVAAVGMWATGVVSVVHIPTAVERVTHTTCSLNSDRSCLIILDTFRHLGNILGE